MELVQEKVDRLLDSKLRPSFEEFETLSKEFDRSEKGYKHSPYLCYIAACCWENQ